MLAIYWEQKSAFQNTFYIYSTTVKPLQHLNLRYSWVPVTVPEALPALKPCKMPVFVQYLFGISAVFVRNFAGIFPVFVRNPVPGFSRSLPCLSKLTPS